LLFGKRPDCDRFTMEGRYVVGLTNLEPELVYHVAAGGKPGCGMVVMNAKLSKCHLFSKQSLLRLSDHDRDHFPSINGMGEIWMLYRNEKPCSHRLTVN